MTSDKTDHPPRVLVIGMGNEYRSDDAVGLLVIRQLQPLLPAGAVAIEHDGDGMSLPSLWEETDAVIVVDAAASPDAPGSIRRWDALEDPIPADWRPFSSHSFGLAEAVALSRALGRPPRRLVAYCIRGKDFGLGVELSAPVRVVLPEVVRLVQDEIASLLGSIKNAA